MTNRLLAVPEFLKRTTLESIIRKVWIVALIAGALGVGYRTVVGETPKNGAEVEVRCKVCRDGATLGCDRCTDGQQACTSCTDGIDRSKGKERECWFCEGTALQPCMSCVGSRKVKCPACP